MHRKIKIAITTLLLVLNICACAQTETQQLTLDEVEMESTDEDVSEDDSIFVYVCGAVVSEGVYELPIGSRVYEAIQMAGGFAENAAGTQINQAEILEDETRLYVPTLEEAANAQMQENGKVNLNTATKEELMTLPGVGDAKAGQIIQYREENGNFKAIEDVMNISGIKEGLFSKIKDYITV